LLHFCYFFNSLCFPLNFEFEKLFGTRRGAELVREMEQDSESTRLSFKIY